MSERKFVTTYRHTRARTSRHMRYSSALHVMIRSREITQRARVPKQLTPRKETKLPPINTLRSADPTYGRAFIDVTVCRSCNDIARILTLASIIIKPQCESIKVTNIY